MLTTSLLMHVSKESSGIPWDEAYTVIKHNADNDRLGWQGFGHSEVVDSAMASYKSRGWIPAGGMSCSKSLEYSYNDFCAAEIAHALNYHEDHQKYLTRSKEWINLWNPDAISDGFKGFVVPRSPMAGGLSSIRSITGNRGKNISTKGVHGRIRILSRTSLQPW